MHGVRMTKTGNETVEAMADLPKLEGPKPKVVPMAAKLFVDCFNRQGKERRSKTRGIIDIPVARHGLTRGNARNLPSICPSTVPPAVKSVLHSTTCPMVSFSMSGSMQRFSMFGSPFDV